MRTSRTRSRTLVAALGIAVALTASACGSDDPSTVDQGAAAQTVDGISTERNDVDIAFIKDMSPHHSAAVEMAKLAPTRAADPKVKDLAARIAGAQEPEIALMARMAKAWQVDLAAGGGMSMGGGGMDDDVKALTPLTGAAFDKEFLTRMKVHHESALMMAKLEVDGGKNPQAKALAGEITTTQTKEIAEITGLLAAL